VGEEGGGEGWDLMGGVLVWGWIGWCGGSRAVTTAKRIREDGIQGNGVGR